MLENFTDVFTNIPGRIDLIECEISLRDQTFIKMTNYKIPDAIRLQFEEQITKMFQLGIIEESNSCIAPRSWSLRNVTDPFGYGELYWIESRLIATGRLT